MPDSNEDIKLYEVGEYSSLIRRPNPNGFVIVKVPDMNSFIPSLELENDRKYTQQEIDRMNEKAVAVVLTKDEAEKVTACSNE